MGGFPVSPSRSFFFLPTYRRTDKGWKEYALKGKGGERRWRGKEKKKKKKGKKEVEDADRWEEVRVSGMQGSDKRVKEV